MRLFAPKFKWLSLIILLAAGVCWSPRSFAQGRSRNQPSGHVTGHIDGLRFGGGQFHIWGWACQQGAQDSIAILLYADRSASDRPKGTLVLASVANLPNEQAVAALCQDQKGQHRFVIDLPNQMLSTYRTKKIFIQGIRVSGDLENTVLARSGEFQFPDLPVFRIMPTLFAPVTGTYRSSSEHPRVFLAPGDLNDMAARINTPGTFSAQSFARLSTRVKADLAAQTDWEATYSGCDIDIYLHAFSIEPTGGYASEIRSEEQLRAALHVPSGDSPPHGAAVVAARLALYAALVKAGARGPQPKPDADAAVLLAKKIALAWAKTGFRGRNGAFFFPPEEFCDAAGKPAFSGALQISRGVVYSIEAQDLLQGLRALSAAEEAQLNGFHSQMYEWIRNTHNNEIDRGLKGPHPEETYNNQTANHLVALLAAARLLDDKERFEAALNGSDPAIPLSLPWNELFNYVVYGESDTPLIRITPNSSDDPAQRSAAYSNKVAAPGEINDRYRNLTALQGIGYPVGTLNSLFSAAEIMRIAGFDGYGYRGFRQQSIEMAARYYACYGQHVGFYKTVTAEAGRECPDYQQYVGKVVNGVESIVLIGSYRFSGDPAITEQEDAARAQTTKEDALDTVLFGKWRN